MAQLLELTKQQVTSKVFCITKRYKQGTPATMLHSHAVTTDSGRRA